MQKHIIASFTITIFLLIALGVTSVIKLIELSKLSEDLYNHPFTVTNSTKRIKINLVSMHRYMKDVALSNNDEELNKAIMYVNKSEIIIYQEFDTVFKQYLGDREDIQKSYDAFVNWKPIRDKVIFLVRNNKKEEAAKITKGIGANHVKKLNAHVGKLVEYAQNKASFFRNNAKENGKEAIVFVIVLIGIILFIVTSMLFFLLKNINESAIKTKKYLHLIDQNIMDLSLTIDLRIKNVSNAFIRFTGLSKEELLKKDENYLYKNTSKFDKKELLNTISSGKTFFCEIEIEVANNEKRWLESAIHPTFNENYEVVGYNNILTDITSKKQIEEISRHDGLTNLYNRRFFDEEFSKQINIAQRNKTTLAFVLIDIDYFKNYNDTYGHQLGDKALIAVAKVLKASIARLNDSSFRLGGEEFGMLFNINSEEEAEKIAEKTRHSVEELKIEHKENKASSYITISLGVIVIPYDTKLTKDEIFHKADEALYLSKENGRNQISLTKAN